MRGVTSAELSSFCGFNKIFQRSKSIMQVFALLSKLGKKGDENGGVFDVGICCAKSFTLFFG